MASSGSSSASLWPPVKLYLAKPAHLPAGGGRPGAKSGAKSNEAMDAYSLQAQERIFACNSSFRIAAQRQGRNPCAGVIDCGLLAALGPGMTGALSSSPDSTHIGAHGEAPEAARP